MDAFASVTADPFSGVTVDLGEEAGMGPDEFADVLGGFLDACEAEGKRGVWLNAPLEATLEAMHQAGFEGDVYPPVELWNCAPTGVFATYPFPESVDRMRQGSS